MRRLASITCLILASLVVFCACGRREPSFDRALRIRHGSSSTLVRVALARTEPDRERGLMGVRHLPADGGMAFLFARPTTRGFWMKDTLVRLSVAFWDRDGRIVAILDMTPCHRDPCHVYAPGRPYVGALETHLGFFRAHGIVLRDHVRLDTR